MDKTLYIRKGTSLAGFQWYILVLTCTLLFHSCKGKKENGIRILFTGDIMLSRNVGKEIRQKNESPFGGMDSLFRSADLVIGNFEGAIGKIDTSYNPKSLVFPVDESLIRYLKQAGFGALSVENNHNHDLGDSGKQGTISVLQDNKITPVSFSNSPQFIKVKDKVIALVGINLIRDRDSCMQKIPSAEILQKLRLAKALSDLAVVFIHWGNELVSWPDERQRNEAKWLAENGADLIIGCHPHVIQEPEMIAGKPVFFSLGNLLFDQKYYDTKRGLIADCMIRDGKLECNGIFTHTGKNTFYPVIAGTKQYNLPSVSLHSSLKVSGFILKGDRDKSGKVILSGSDGKSSFRSFPINMVSASRAYFGDGKEYLFTVEKHYSNMDNEIGFRPYVYSVTANGLVSRWRGSALGADCQ